MARRLFHLGTIITLGALLVVQFGCTGSPSSRFYLLSSLSRTGQEAKAPTDENCPSIGIGPISVPGYLDQPQVVTRTTGNELLLAEFDRWAEPLRENFTRVLSQNISTLLCTKSVVLFPWQRRIPVDYRIEMDVLRFDGTLGGNASLEAWWRVFSGDGRKMLVAKKSSFSEPVDGKDFGSLISAQSRALGRLSSEIAEAIRTLMK
jgi:uncharacterized lipoprotein YmbA